MSPWKDQEGEYCL